MALDGILLSYIAREINTRLEGGRVDRIMQPEKDEIDILFRMHRGSARLLISASASNPRIHFTGIGKENPASPPMFCMLLRKHLSGARFAGAEQRGFERILFLHFDCRNELGDEVRMRLAVEIMGRHSNLILLDEHGRILDAIKHVDEAMSSRRQVLPGLTYTLPPPQDKLDPLAASPEEIVARVSSQNGELAKALLGTMQGVSPVVCRELAQLACRDAGARLEQMTPEQAERLIFFLRRFQQAVKKGEGDPTLILDAKTKKPLDFSFIDITQYGAAALCRRCESFSALLDEFFAERDRIERITQRAHDIYTVISNAVERVSRRLDNQRADLKACKCRDRLRIFGDLISANIYRLQKGMSRCEVENFYEEGTPKVAIELDPALTPQQNAQKYYKEYRKASAAESFLKAQIESGEHELLYLESVFDELSRAACESELDEIREELVSEGYLKSHGAKHRQRAGETLPLRFRSTDGFEILIGRNNRQNDRLTLKTAANSDLWLHTRNIPGAHVIIRTGGRQVTENALIQAAQLAALHSRARESSRVPVDYTLVKNVKKPSGAKPGMVIYTDFRTVFVNPDPSLEESLRI